MTKVMRSHHDVVVVGARCAGSTTAMLLARMGHDVVVIDKARLPSDTLSTHAIVRGGVVQLQRWGLLDPLLGTGAPPIKEVSFHTAAGTTARTVKAQAGVDHLIAPRRHVLDALLADAAVAAGADLRTGVTATDVLRDATGRVAGVQARNAKGATVELGASFVVGADGVWSRTADHVGAEVQEHFTSSCSAFYTYVGGVDWRGFEFHVGPDAFAGVFPTHDDQACVWLIRPTHAFASMLQAGADRTEAWLDQLGTTAPGLATRVRAGRITARLRGAVNMPNHIRRPAGPGWALVGDAGYHRDPITGHGITDAFRDAELLSCAISQTLRDPSVEPEAMTSYHRRRDRALRETFDITRELAAFPAPDRFVELQIELSEVLEREAQELADGPPLPKEVVDFAA